MWTDTVPLIIMRTYINRRRQQTRTPGLPKGLVRAGVISVGGNCSLVTWTGMSRSPALSLEEEDKAALTEQLADLAPMGFAGPEDMVKLLHDRVSLANATELH